MRAIPDMITMILRSQLGVVFDVLAIALEQWREMFDDKVIKRLPKFPSCEVTAAFPSA